jgi:predicted flavoprotein YhiN
MVMNVGKSKICRVDQPARDSARGDAAVQGPRPSATSFFLARGGQSLGPFGSSTDWMRTIHVMEGNVHYSSSTNLNDNLIPKHLHRST